MQIQHKASALLVSLILISGILSILFLSKDKFIQQESISHFYTEKYLLDKQHFLSFYPKNKDKLCQQFKKELITQQDLSAQNNYFMEYQFNCQFYSLFKDKKPTRDKYIPISQLSDFLDLSNIAKEDIYFIRSLSELPPSSENDPKIVIAQNDIDENLPQDFYGIVITDYLFDIRGKKMYGVLYSSYDNAREERNLTFRRAVINNLENKYSYWKYLPNSENSIGNP